MFAEYIEAALERAVYKTLEDEEEPIFVSVPELPGAWATGRTVEEARKELIGVIEEWILLGIRLGHPIPPIGGHTISFPRSRFLLSNRLTPVSRRELIRRLKNPLAIGELIPDWAVMKVCYGQESLYVMNG